MYRVAKMYKTGEGVYVSYSTVFVKYKNASKDWSVKSALIFELHNESGEKKRVSLAALFEIRDQVVGIYESDKGDGVFIYVLSDYAWAFAQHMDMFKSEKHCDKSDEQMTYYKLDEWRYIPDGMFSLDPVTEKDATPATVFDVLLHKEFRDKYSELVNVNIVRFYGRDIDVCFKLDAEAISMLTMLLGAK